MNLREKDYKIAEIIGVRSKYVPLYSTDIAHTQLLKRFLTGQGIKCLIQLYSDKDVGCCLLNGALVSTEGAETESEAIVNATIKLYEMQYERTAAYITDIITHP